MASGKPLLNVVVSPKAASDLDQIYRYNAKKRGLTPADRYIAFLRTKIASLAIDYDEGKPVEVRPNLRYLLMKKRSGGDGHIAVYRIEDATATVRVLHVFHTKQDWENKL